MPVSSALFRSRICSVFLLLLCVLCPRVRAQSPAAPLPHSAFALVPAEFRSTHFTVTVNGVKSPVMLAAGKYYLLNFEINGPSQVTVTADDPHYWDAGVEVQPMRWGIRPHRDGASISFPLDGPVKLSITRPGDHFAESEMLFLFANAPDSSGINASTAGVRYYGPGIHRENIDAKDGDRIYLAAGAVILGSLNIWQVHDVHVSGYGTILYDGPQNPNDDEGWMHKRNWHVIVMDNARDIDIEGITGIVRSRTWMVQMRDSHGITFRNVKIIGGSPGNANQDGMDWLGGGDTLVQDSFFRAADDVFAMQGNWDGYSEEAITTPGHEVSNVTVENSVLSTSISNVVRLGWPRKIFDSHGFTMRDSDVIHMGDGACGVPFALFEIWADPDGKGKHTDIHFENIRLEDWYSLVQLRQPNPSIEDVSFTNVWAMDGPGLAPSALKGDVSGVTFRGVNLGGGSDVESDATVSLTVTDGAREPSYAAGALDAGFTYSSGLIRPGTPVAFQSKGAPGVRYHWLFGDGGSADGPAVQHTFADTDGTLLDGSGRFRVLLLASDDKGNQAWGSQSIVTATALLASAAPAATEVHDQGLSRSATGYRGFLSVPSDGGYTLTMLTSTTATLTVDGKTVSSRKLHPQVCGSPGAAVAALRLSLALAQGRHRIELTTGPEVENAGSSGGKAEMPPLLWEGPGQPREIVLASALAAE